MTTAIIGVGNLGGAVARTLVAGGEPVVLAAGHEARSQALADELGPLARAASVEDAIASADVVVYAVWLETTRALIPKHQSLLADKIVVDPSNPVGWDEQGQTIRTLPEGQSAASIIVALLPIGTQYVKAFGTLGADALASSGGRDPRAVLFYATDDHSAVIAIERLIRAAGYEPLRSGGVADAGRLEMPSGDLHQAALNGALLDIDQARAAVAGKTVEA